MKIILLHFNNRKNLFLILDLDFKILCAKIVFVKLIFYIIKINIIKVLNMYF